MMWSSLSDLDFVLGLIMIILYGLFCLRYQLVALPDVTIFCRFWPLLLLVGYVYDGVGMATDTSLISHLVSSAGLDFLLAALTFFILNSFKSFESMLLILFAFIGQIGIMHSCDLVSFYVSLEIQNFCFLVLCGLQPACVAGCA